MKDLEKNNIKEEDFPKDPENITKDELHEHFDLDNDGKVNIEEYSEHVNYHCDNPEVLEDKIEEARYNRGFKYKKGGKTKEAKTWKEKFNKKYGNPLSKSNSLAEIAKKTGKSKKGLQKIYNKGIGAYKTNPQSVRPNVKSKEQWAQARVYSAVMGGKAAKVDAKELRMAKGGMVGDIIRVSKTPYMTSFSDLYDKDLKIKDIKEIEFGSGKKKEFIVELNGKDYNIPHDMAQTYAKGGEVGIKVSISQLDFLNNELRMTIDDFYDDEDEYFVDMIKTLMGKIDEAYKNYTLNLTSSEKSYLSEQISMVIGEGEYGDDYYLSLKELEDLQNKLDSYAKGGKIGDRKDLKQVIDKSLDESKYVYSPLGWTSKDTRKLSKKLTKNLKTLKSFPDKKITESFVREFVDELEGYTVRKPLAVSYLTREFYDYFYKGKGVFAKGGLTQAKAKKMLEDGTAQGKKLTDKQKRYFGYIAGGGKGKYAKGGKTGNYELQLWETEEHREHLEPEIIIPDGATDEEVISEARMFFEDFAAVEVKRNGKVIFHISSDKPEGKRYAKGGKTGKYPKYVNGTLVGYAKGGVVDIDKVIDDWLSDEDELANVKKDLETHQTIFYPDYIKIKLGAGKGWKKWDAQNQSDSDKLYKKLNMAVDRNLNKYKKGGKVNNNLVKKITNKVLKDLDPSALEEPEYLNETITDYIYENTNLPESNNEFMEIYYEVEKGVKKGLGDVRYKTKYPKFKKGGKVYMVKDMDEFDDWYDWISDNYEPWKYDEVHYEGGGVYISDEIYNDESIDTLNRDNLYLEEDVLNEKIDNTANNIMDGIRDRLKINDDSDLDDELYTIVHNEIRKTLEKKYAKGGRIVRVEDLNKGDILEGKPIKMIDRFPDYTGVWFKDGDYRRYTKGSTTKKDYKKGCKVKNKKITVKSDFVDLKYLNRELDRVNKRIEDVLTKKDDKGNINELERRKIALNKLISYKQ